VTVQTIQKEVDDGRDSRRRLRDKTFADLETETRETEVDHKVWEIPHDYETIPSTWNIGVDELQNTKYWREDWCTLSATWRDLPGQIGSTPLLTGQWGEHTDNLDVDSEK
jgi:hypothetical protein